MFLVLWRAVIRGKEMMHIIPDYSFNVGNAKASPEWFDLAIDLSTTQHS